VGTVIEARRKSAWSGGYELELDGEPLATFERSVWRNGGRFVVGGRPYEVTSNLWASSYTLVADDGSTVASAQRVGRKDWTVEADRVTYQFRRASVWRQEEELTLGGQPVGSVKRTSMWGGGAVADLPGLPPVVAVFAVAVVLTTWDLAASAT
jgi:hypothetical protein